MLKGQLRRGAKDASLRLVDIATPHPATARIGQDLGPEELRRRAAAAAEARQRQIGRLAQAVIALTLTTVGVTYLWGVAVALTLVGALIFIDYLRGG